MVYLLLHYLLWALHQHGSFFEGITVLPLRHLNIFSDLLNNWLRFYLRAIICLLNDLLNFYFVSYRIYLFNFLEHKCSFFYAVTFLYYYFAFVYLWLFVFYDVF